MILGTGIDLVDSRRIEKLMEKHSERFIDRYFTEKEQELIKERKKSGQDIMTLAKRFAAKEACAKALGTGFIDGLQLRDIEVFSDDFGKPYIALSGKADELVQAMLPKGSESLIHLSLTDEVPYAQAQVIIESI
ncbi:MAG: holo-ACP synthase [Pseudomonadota bacterium]